MAAFYTFVNRALKICSNSDTLADEINYLKSVATQRGYSSSIIDVALKKLTKPRPETTLEIDDRTDKHNLAVIPFIPTISTKIARILKPFDFKIIYLPMNKIPHSPLKDKINIFNSWGIYQISCQCNLSYIGQTRRALKFRLREHKNYVKNCELKKSTVAQHCWENDHTFLFDQAKIIQKVRSTYELDFYEALHIYLNTNNIVNDHTSTPFISEAWKRVADLLATPQQQQNFIREVGNT